MYKFHTDVYILCELNFPYYNAFKKTHSTMNQQDFVSNGLLDSKFLNRNFFSSKHTRTLTKFIIRPRNNPHDTHFNFQFTL